MVIEPIKTDPFAPNINKNGLKSDTFVKMNFKQSFLLDVLIVAFSFFFVLRLFWFQQDLEREESVATAAKKELSTQVSRPPVNTSQIYEVDQFKVKPPKELPSPPTPVKPRVVAPPPPKPVQTTPVVTRLPLELHGMIQDEDLSVAFIFNTAKKTTGVYQVNEIIMPGVKLTEIQATKVLIDNRGSIQELVYKGYSDPLEKLLSSGKTFTARDEPDTEPSNSRASAAQEEKFEVSNEGDNVFVTQKEARRQVSQLSTLLSQVRVQPNFTRSGRADGFKILHVNRGSFVEALGINSGDIIKSINGTVVDSMQKGYELFNTLKNDTSVDVEIIRDNQPKTVHFEMR